MSKGTKMKQAARRIKWAQRRATAANKPCLLSRLWTHLRHTDVVGMINLTLLVAIIVLFSMLIIDITRNTRPCPAPATPVPQVTVTDASAPRNLRPRPVTRMTIPTPAPTDTPVTTPVVKYDLYGDTVIDSRDAGRTLRPDMRVRGNVYLQNMRKFTLPCGLHIDGNLFLRDMGMLRFCGEFTVTGNIYVSPRSSFGPIPRTAHVGGHVIL